MINYFKFNGVSSADFGIYVGGQLSFTAPQKSIIKANIPGRNGDFILDTGVFNNVMITYVIVGIGNFKEKINQLKEWLLSPTGYAKIEDTYNPNHYRMGILANGIDWIMYSLNTTGKANITFDCKPQRWLVSGDDPIELGVSGTLINPTKFDAKPLIHVEGYGNITINGTQITIANTFPEVYIDCEAMDCYSGNNENANLAVSFSTNDFPKLKSGNNSYSVNSMSITEAEVSPRWWTV